MKNFNIKELENLSGVKAHTIRIWERRYVTFQPERTQSNSRFYTIEQLKLLLNISLLIKNGFRISQLSYMDAHEIDRRLSLLLNNENKKEKTLNALITSMYSMDILSFENILNQCFLFWQDEEVITDIIFSFLERTSLLWKGNNIPEEHFAVTALRAKLTASIEKKRAVRQNKTILIFLPDSKQLDMLLLYAQYLLKCSGWEVFNMGLNVSIANLKAACKAKQPNFVFTYLPIRHNFPVAELSAYMNDHLPSSKFILTVFPNHIHHQPATDNLLQMSCEEALSFFQNPDWAVTSPQHSSYHSS